jgi:hypothetical protein
MPDRFLHGNSKYRYSSVGRGKTWLQIVTGMDAGTKFGVVKRWQGEMHAQRSRCQVDGILSRAKAQISHIPDDHLSQSLLDTHSVI